MTTPEQTQKRRKVRAILASGLVLGVGAAVTLAAWNDSVWGSSILGTGDSTWGLEGSIDGGDNWAEFATEGAAGTMSFTPPNGALQPGVPAFSVFGLHETGGDLAASVGLTKEAFTDSTPSLGEHITVTATVVSGANTDLRPTCDASTTGQQLFSGALNTALASDTDFTIPAGQYAWVCFKAELASSAATNPALQGLTTTTTWKFDGESV